MEMYKLPGNDTDATRFNNVVAVLVPRSKEWYERQIQTLRTMCQYCYKARASILLLPCAHVSCCKDCLPLIRRCPVSTCNKIVRGTKEIFFV
ncbi:hypothetical protein LSH36_1702g00011 [Paralvinella palmiformis]|uniref:RING-type domain-containing protein n=1 Tax=Paralvinella palmiformis TaxID=53620 RepID=A0AAD9IS40_9ANNE|nr:hypothetical protein LSH36_1702g00011 [Paralvinella palmiformis]